MSQIIKNLADGPVPPSVATLYTENSGTAVPAANNLNVFGNNTANNGYATYTVGSGSTITIDSYGLSKWVVNPTAGVGTHQTITAAIASASSGDTVFITPGTYTENFTLKSGVNLTAFVGDDMTPTVQIIGKMSYAATGAVTLTGIRIVTNADNFLTLTGTNPSQVYFQNCSLFTKANVTGISFTSSSSGSVVEIYDCDGDVSDTGSNLFASTSPGTMIINNTILTNGLTTGTASTTASTISAGKLYIFTSDLDIQVSSSGSSSVYADKVTMSSSLSGTSQNVTRLSLDGSGANTVISSNISSGSASAIAVNTATSIVDTTVTSSNTNAISGSAALTATNINFNGSSSGIQPTITPLVTQIGTLHLTTPLITSGFFAYLNTTASSVTGDGTVYQIVYDTTDFDIASEFNTGTGIFTATLTGYYTFTWQLTLSGLAPGISAGTHSIVTTGRTLTYDFDPLYLSDASGQGSVNGSVTLPMTAGDTAKITTSVSGIAKVVNVQGLTGGAIKASFSGFRMNQ